MSCFGNLYVLVWAKFLQSKRLTYPTLFDIYRCKVNLDLEMYEKLLGSIMIDFEKLKVIFKEYPYIASAYLFGSTFSGKRGPMSDLDIAILLRDPHPVGRELIHEEDYLAYRIAKALSVKEVDVVNLNSQPIIFQHSVLRNSKLIYDADTLYRIIFESRIISEYCDFEPTLRFMDKFRLQGIKKRLGRI